MWGSCTPLVTKDDLCGDTGSFDMNDADNLALLDVALGWASERFIMATRGRFKGCCTAVVRPAPWPANCQWGQEYVGWFDGDAMPMQVAAGPGELRVVNCWHPRCTAPTHISLPYLPVREVVEVKIDGVVLDPGDWYLTPGTNTLRRTDGRPWPTSQLPTLAADVAGTWSVTERYGLDAPPSARPLIANYGLELAKRCTGAPCELDEGVRIKSRPGVEYDLDIGVLDVDYRLEGLTGYRPLDDWCHQLFAGQAKTRPRLWHGRPVQNARG